MKKQYYIAPETNVSQLETISMLANSPSLSTSGNPAKEDLGALSNQDIWGNGLW